MFSIWALEERKKKQTFVIIHFVAKQYLNEGEKRVCDKKQMKTLSF